MPVSQAGGRGFKSPPVHHSKRVLIWRGGESSGMSTKLKEEFLKLLEEDREFRYTVAGLIGLGEILEAIRDLQGQVLENIAATRKLQGQMAALQEQVLEHSKAIRALQEQMVEHSKRIEGLTRTVQALGARWGFIAEDAFREGMRGIIEEFFGGRVERWIYRDEEGFVFGHPSVVEVDVVVRDGEHVLVEVKSSLSRADIYELWRKGQLYERVKGVKPRLVAVSPYVDERGRREAERLGIEVYTSTMEPYPSGVL